jgi:hypothetical protein
MDLPATVACCVAGLFDIAKAVGIAASRPLLSTGILQLYRRNAEGISAC